MAQISHKMDNHEIPIDPDELTVDATGVMIEELKEKARKMTEAAMILKFYSNLVKEKTGTNDIENKAYKFVKDRNSKEGVRFDPEEDIFEGRDPEMVVDLLMVKIKYARRAEEYTKKEYEKGKR